MSCKDNINLARLHGRLSSAGQEKSATFVVVNDSSGSAWSMKFIKDRMKVESQYCETAW